MEKRLKNHNKPHCLILPYPIQGHINPMLQFSKRLHHKVVQITLALTKQLAKTIHFTSETISLITISDGFDEGTPSNVDAAAYIARFHNVGSETLKQAMQDLAGSGRPVDCVVYDPLLSWGLSVAKESGAEAAAFFTQSCAVNHVFSQVYGGELNVPLSSDEIIKIPGLPALKPEDMPSFIYVHGSYPPIFELLVDQFKGLEMADWVFCNTFYKLEEEVIHHMAESSPVKAIGPTIPSMYVDNRIPDDNQYGLSFFKPITEVCMNWLKQQPPESVVYVSFGSLAQLGNEQMEELAWGLRLSNKNFLWVVRSSEESKLPHNFIQETSERSLIVSWCPQLDVLSHEAIGCFVTHCGWNSTLEALSLGVPMVAVPQWSDQSTNSKFVMDVWKMGTWAKVDERGLVGREMIARCIKDVMDGEATEEITNNAKKWKELAREAMDEGGSSDKNIEEFVSSLRLKSLGFPKKENFP